MRLTVPSGKRDRRGLKELLTEAVQRGILQDSGFPSLPHRIAEGESLLQAIEQDSGEKIPRSHVSYVNELTENLPKIRNSFAHPHNHWIITPGMALDGICVATEVINQLWPDPLQAPLP